MVRVRALYIVCPRARLMVRALCAHKSIITRLFARSTGAEAKVATEAKAAAAARKVAAV